MQEVQYIGETLWPGIVGHLAVLIALVSALSGAIAFFKGMRSPGSSWTSLGRTFFIVHGGSVLLVIGLLFFMMLSQFYDYAYVWEHVSAELPLRYIFSAIWAG
ncbi:MAG: cytochrome c assembly protein, partial [Saprospiraceae bacterium]|nr:cytochrome c assembly protein [Saprospiraceae bacterium]